jgi:hypothetical protein
MFMLREWKREEEEEEVEEKEEEEKKERTVKENKLGPSLREFFSPSVI